MQPLISSSSQLLYTWELLLSHGPRCHYRLGPVAASPFIEKQLKHVFLGIQNFPITSLMAIRIYTDMGLIT